MTNIQILYLCRINIHGKNDFTEVSKNLTEDTNLKN